MQSRGWDVDVVSMLPPVDLVDDLEQAGVSVSTLNMSPIPNPMAIFKLAGMVRHKGTVVLHSHMAKANFLGRIAGAVARVPVQVSTAHNIVEGGRWIELTYRLTDRLADVTTNVSQRAVDRYVAVGAVPRSRIRLMYNGLETSAFERDHRVRIEYRDRLRTARKFCWLAVGRLAPGKDYPNMIRAFRRVVDSNREAHLLVVGKGPLTAEVGRLVADAGLSEHVTMLGERKDIAALMSAADGYVMSSAWEGAPMVLLEASASRLPVVTTDVGGNAELVRHGETGIVVQPDDSVALAEAMLEVMKMPDEVREQFGRAGHAFIEREFSLPTVLDRWEELYETLIKRKTA